MIAFLTSSLTGRLDGSRIVEGMDDKNYFRENLRRYWRENARCLMISAFPNDIEANMEMQSFFAEAVKRSGFSICAFDIWDCRTEDFSRETLHSYDVILLGGGHVPTQNDFFREIGLRESIQDFDGIVIGISAGSMNSADIVYAQPELPGEALDPGYVRFLSGLGLTKTNILPHYQMVRENELDRMRLFEDITYGDSYGKSFLTLPDGSYLLIENGKETVYGEAYMISNGECWQICRDDESCGLL